MKKAAMIFPDRESEKAISGYSVTLTDAIRKRDLDIEDINYTAGKPLTLLKKIKEIRKYDVVHIQHEYNLLGWYGLPFFVLYFLLLFSKVRVVTTMHTALSLKEKFSGGKIKTIFRKLLYITQNRVINLCSDKVVVHASFFKKILIKEYGFQSKKFEIFPQAIIEDAPIMSKEKAKKKFGLKGAVYVIMGGFVPDHGADIVIKQAKEIGPTILVVANPSPVNDRNKKRTGDYLKENMDFVKDNKLMEDVRFDIINITDKKPEWWEYFCASDLVLLPYRGGIGSGIFAHAMATRRPVIASNIQFFNEISKNFGCLKIAKSEKDYPRIIKEAMKNSNLKKMEEECERYVQKYGLSKLANRYIETYKRL